MTNTHSFIYEELVDKNSTKILKGRDDTTSPVKLCPFFVFNKICDDERCMKSLCGLWSDTRKCCGLINTIK